MQTSSKSRQSIKAAIELATSLEITTTAEGIEDNLEAIVLRELGCQFGQGSFFATPMNDMDTLKWFEYWNKNLSHAT